MVSALLTRVRGIFQRLLSRAFPLPSMPEPPPPSVKARRKASNLCNNPRALLIKRAASAKRAKSKKS